MQNSCAKNMLFLSLCVSLVVSSCADIESPCEPLNKNGAHGKGARIVSWSFDDFMDVSTTIVADGSGMWAGSKAGGLIGATLGPKGALFGGVVGAIIGGGTASWGTARGLRPLLVGPSTPSTWTTNSPYNSMPNTSDSVGYLHNELVKYLTSNAVLNNDGTIDHTQFYTLSVAFLSNRGYDSVSYYFPYSSFYSVSSTYTSIESMSAIKSYLSSTYGSTNAVEVAYWSDLCDSLSTLAASNPSQAAVSSLISSFESGVSNLSISAERKEYLRIGLRGARWSYALWEGNVF
jgi:hypothetical protein